MAIQTSYVDPQFRNTLEVCLSAEIQTTKDALSSLESEINGYKAQLRTLMTTKKDLKESAKNVHENVLVLSAASARQDHCLHETSNKIELMKLDLDNSYKIMKLEREHYATIVNEYERTWRLYHEKYEAFPLAKTRKEAKVKLAKLQVSKMILQFKIAAFQKISKLDQHVTWLRMRGKIVELARAILNKLQLEEEYNNLTKSIKDSKEELKAIETKLAIQLKRKEEEKEVRALKVIEMQPPSSHISHIRTIHGRKRRADFLNYWKKNEENSIDTLSVDTMVLDEGCLEDSAAPPQMQTSSKAAAGEGRVYKDQSINLVSPFRDQIHLEVEQEDAVGETDRKEDSEAIDAPYEEVEQRMDQELEHLEQPASVSKDKQTGQYDEEFVEEVADPLAKRMRLISDDRGAVASPGKIKRLEKKRSDASVANSLPRIRKIEAVQFNVSPLKKLGKSDVRLPIGSRVKELIAQSVEQRSPKMSPARKDKNLIRSSMFTPRNYDYSDTSIMSFCVEDLGNLKADQISLDEQSIRDFCECTDVSSYNEDATKEPVVKSDANAASLNKSQNFPQFDFSNFLGRNPSRNNLF